MKRFLEFITEARTSQAAQQAKKLGLSGDGHGFWIDKECAKKAKTIKGKLEFIQQKKKKSDGEDTSQRQSPATVTSKKLPKAKPAPKRLGAKATQSPSERSRKPQESGTKSSGSQQQPKGPNGDVVTIAFGKFNPPTKAHKNLLNTLKQSASGGNFYIFPSRAQDGKKNPLSADVKIDFMKAMFPEYADKIIDSEEFKTIFDVLSFLNQEGYSTVNIVCGSERCSEIDNLAKKQNGQLYNFSSINVISSGPKDPDAQENSSVARKAAASGDFETFKKSMPTGVQPKLIKQLFSELGGSLEVKETWQISPDLDPKGLRENYVFGNLYKVGDVIESCNTGLRGEIIRHGANHLICVTEGGIMFKSWIKDIALV
jgi:hypothetical protein